MGAYGESTRNPAAKRGLCLSRTEGPIATGVRLVHPPVGSAFVFLHPSGARFEEGEESEVGMPDQQDVESVDPPAMSLSTQIGRALASVWAYYCDSRPSQAETHVEGNVVRWMLANGTREFEDGMAAHPDDPEGPDKPRTIAGYKRDTSAAVTKATDRRVLAMMSKHDANTGIATETFILDRVDRRY